MLHENKLSRELADALRFRDKYGAMPQAAAECLSSLNKEEKAEVWNEAKRLIRENHPSSPNIFDSEKDSNQKELWILAKQLETAGLAKKVGEKLSKSETDAHGTVFVEIPTFCSFDIEFKQIFKKMLFLADSMSVSIVKADEYRSGKPDEKESLLLILLRNYNIRLDFWVYDIWKEFDWPKRQDADESYELLKAAPDLENSIFKSKDLRMNLMLSSARSLAESRAIKCVESESSVAITTPSHADFKHKHKRAFHMILSFADQVSVGISSKNEDEPSSELENVASDYDIMMLFGFLEN
ncbi:MAG: hypothetical protein LBC41_13175 [Clostridiales bacterium]|nr:hypothetical protein [Clostridiales bacterium]